MFQIRQMLEADIPQACQLWKECDGVTLEEWETPELIADAIRNFGDLNVVADEDGEILGAVLGGYFGLRGLIQHLAVNPEHRRRGIATAMLQFCFQSYAKRNIRRILLGVRNPDAIAFYRSVGFSDADTGRLMWRDV